MPWIPPPSRKYCQIDPLNNYSGIDYQKIWYSGSNPITASSAILCRVGDVVGAGHFEGSRARQVALLRLLPRRLPATNPFNHPSLYLNLPPAFFCACAPGNVLKFLAASHHDGIVEIMPRLGISFSFTGQVPSQHGKSPKLTIKRPSLAPPPKLRKNYRKFTTK